ncbi:LysR family transcriptional regulator [Sulfurovum sp.]|uniref:LysR family transcriptional regulator n=1 Tax=Sulfurovum sp. TaxID=1969726 RepID=UPI0028680A36|nr:LysR family transcriptional regulator [Sulfurovum sp.]
MVKDFSKLETFLTVARERSFSKASSKLGITQPAVTQKIKAIEKYLGSSTIERKKSGLILTSEGEAFYKVVSRLEKEILASEKDMLKIINKKMTFRLGASYTIGTCVIPGECLNAMSKSIDNDVSFSIDKSSVIIEKLKDNKLDVGLIESQVMDNDLMYKEWMEDEFVLVSNVPIPKIVNTEDLYDYSWVFREESSPVKKAVTEVFDDLGVSCNNFNVLSEVSNSTVVLQTIKKSKKVKEKPVVSVISKYAIADEVAQGQLFEARLSGYPMTRKFYIVYSKENKHDLYVDNVVDYLLAGNC